MEPKIVKKTFVSFYFPGALVSETMEKEVKNRDIKKLKIPDGAFAFCFYDIFETVHTNMTLQSGHKNHSKIYYPEARVMSLKDVKKEVSNPDILIRNMKTNKWPRVIRCRTGNFQPYYPKNCIILPKEDKKK